MIMVSPEEDFPSIGERNFRINPELEVVVAGDTRLSETHADSRKIAEHGISSKYDERREAYIFYQSLLAEGTAAVHIHPGETTAQCFMETRLFTAPVDDIKNTWPNSGKEIAKLVLDRIAESALPSKEGLALHESYIAAAVMAKEIELGRQIRDEDRKMFANYPGHSQFMAGSITKRPFDEREVRKSLEERAAELSVPLDVHIDSVVQSCALAAIEVEANIISSRIMLGSSVIYAAALASGGNTLLVAFTQNTLNKVGTILRVKTDPNLKIFELTKLYTEVLTQLKLRQNTLSKTPMLSNALKNALNDQEVMTAMIQNRNKMSKWLSECLFEEESQIEATSQLRDQNDSTAETEQEVLNQDNQERSAEILGYAQTLIEQHEVVVSNFRLSRTKLKEMGFKEVIRDMMLGVEPVLPGSAQDMVYSRLSTMVVLNDWLQTTGQKGTQEMVRKTLRVEKLILDGLALAHEAYNQFTVENGFPKITNTLQGNIEWIKENWVGIEHCFDRYEQFSSINDALSAVLELDRTAQLETNLGQATQNSNLLTIEELAELERLEAEEIARQQADEAEYIRLVEEENQRQLAEEAHLLAELEAEQSQAESHITEIEEHTERSIGELAINLPDPELMEIAEELEFEVFPKGASMEQIRISATRLNPYQDKTDWDRIRDLKRIADHGDGGELYISRSTLKAGRTPYYVAVFKLANETIAVAENPVEGNATYIIREALTPGTWQEVLRLPKRLARQVGAAQTVHRNGKDHVKKIMDRIQRLLTVKQYEASSK